jgi:hypothetical protein
MTGCDERRHFVGAGFENRSLELIWRKAAITRGVRHRRTISANGASIITNVGQQRPEEFRSGEVPKARQRAKRECRGSLAKRAR